MGRSFKMKNYIIATLVMIFAYLFGSFAFPQIIGSFRALKSHFKKRYLFSLIFWSILVAASVLLVYEFLTGFIYAYAFVLLIPLILTIRTKNIEQVNVVTKNTVLIEKTLRRLMIVCSIDIYTRQHKKYKYLYKE